MGQRIDQLLPYGSPVYAILESDIFEVSKNSGTVEDPVYESDGSRKITMAELRDFMHHSGVGSGLNYASGKVNLGGELTDNTYITGDAYRLYLSNIDQFNAYLRDSATIAVIGDDFTNQLNIYTGSVSLSYQNILTGNKTFLTGSDDNLDAYWIGSGGEIARVQMTELGIGIDTQDLVGNKTGYLRTDNLTENHTYQFQDKDGIIAHLDDIEGKYLPVTDKTGGKYEYNYDSGGGIETYFKFGDEYHSRFDNGTIVSEMIQNDRIDITVASFPSYSTIGIIPSSIGMLSTNGTNTSVIGAKPTAITFKTGDDYVIEVDTNLLTDSYIAQFPAKSTSQIIAMQSDIAAISGNYIKTAGTSTLTANTTIDAGGNNLSITTTGGNLSTTTGGGNISYITGGGLFKYRSNTNDGNIDFDLLTATRSYSHPDKNGTYAMLSDIPSVSGFVTSVSGTTNRITSTGGTTPVIDISSSYVGQASITTLGTIGAGTWQGTAIADAYVSSAAAWNAKVSSQWVTTGSDVYYSAGSVMIGNATAPTTKLSTVETGSGTLRGVSSYQISATGSSQYNFLAAGGTFASPTTVATGRILSNLNTWAHDGTNYLNVAAIRTTATGTVSTGIVPSVMDFRTTNPAGTMTAGLIIDQNQNIAFASASPAYNSMVGGMYMANATTVPTGDPSGGAYMFIESGVPKMRSSVLTGANYTILTATATGANRIPFFSTANIISSSSSFSFQSNILSITGGINVGGGLGAGRIFLNGQTVRPVSGNSSIMIYSSSTYEFGWTRQNLALSANIYREFAFPDSSITLTYPTPASGGADTLVYLNTAQTFGASNTYAVGMGIKFTTGTNARVGSGTLVAGVLTVANTSVTANTKVRVQLVTTGGTLGVMYSYTVSAGVGFTVTSVSAAGATVITDTSTLDWYLTEFL